MSDYECPKLNVKLLWPSDAQVVALAGPGYLHAAYDANRGHMHLTDMFVPPTSRRQGIARALVTAVRDELIAIGGRHMSGDISTRPSADVMRRVLGHDAVISVVEGEYAPDDADYVPPAIARIAYDVTSSSPSLGQETVILEPVPEAFPPAQTFTFNESR
jgi:GNAT superfamily N-acetyltransferase